MDTVTISRFPTKGSSPILAVILSVINKIFSGEPVRMMFTIAGVPFEDKRIDKADWPELKKSSLISDHNNNNNNNTPSYSIVVTRRL